MAGRFALLAVLALALVAVCSADGQEWGYDDSSTEFLGPSFWYKVSTNCAGNTQSPVNVKLDQVQFNAELGALSVSYTPDRTLQLANNGHTTVVSDLDGEDYVDDTISIPGILAKPYRLAQFHFHWGQFDYSGSEHTINGVGSPAELHLVHYNTKFASITEAVASGETDALAVIGVFYQVGSTTPAALTDIVNNLAKVNEPGEMTNLAGPLDLTQLIPSNKNYYTYKGSLTTPNCNQVVRWILLDQPMQIRREDLNTLRATLLETGPMSATRSTDFRPTQPLNGRSIQSSFPTNSHATASAVPLNALLAVLLSLAAIAALF